MCSSLLKNHSVMLPWGSGSYSPDLIHSKSPPKGPNLQKLLTGGCFLFLSVAGIRYPYQRNLREKGFMLALSSRFQSMDAAKSQQKKPKAQSTPHPKSRGRRRARIPVSAQLTFSILTQLKTHCPRKRCHSTGSSPPPHQVRPSRKPLTNQP